MIDWHDLQFFLAVAKHGTLSAAARALGVTQPTVGRRIAAFELQLGAALFTRTPARWQLSEVGRAVLAHAERMHEHALSAESLATGRDAGLSGKLRITASEWMICSVLGPALAALTTQHPGLQLELIAEARHLNLVKREADIALRPSRFSQPEIVQREVGVIAFGLYASDAYLARHGAPDFARGCEGHALIAMSDDIPNLVDDPWLAPVAAKARIVARTNGREPMATMAAAGMGLTVLPRFLGDATVGLRVIPVPLPGPERKLWLGVHRSARSVPRIRATTTFIARALAGMQTALCPSPRDPRAVGPA